MIQRRSKRRILSGRRISRPACEPLENRVVPAVYTTLDPAFGQKGEVVSPLDTGSGSTLSNATAVAVQADGKIVLAGTYAIPDPTNTSAPGPMLAVRRFNANGTVDATFGTNGQASIPLPAGTKGILTAPHRVVIQPNGTIDVAATALTSGSSNPRGLVAQLTPAGQLDSTFGTGGMFSLADSTLNSFADLGLRSGGGLVVLGTNYSAAVTSQVMLIGLTPAGTLDTSFNGTGIQQFAAPQGLGSPSTDDNGTALAIASSGQIEVLSYGRFPSGLFGATFTNYLARVNADGTVDTTFGTSGTEIVPNSLRQDQDRLADVAILPDGGVLLVGMNQSDATGLLIRLLPNGSADATFASPSRANLQDEFLFDTFLNSVIVGADGKITIGGSSAGYNLFVGRLLSTGATDPSFGTGGRSVLTVPITVPAGVATSPLFTTESVNGLALTTADQVVLAGGVTIDNTQQNLVGHQGVLARVVPVRVVPLPNDYDGDGKSDIAAELTADGLYAIRPSGGGPDLVVSYGSAGAGQSIPAPGTYTPRMFNTVGIRADLALYLPAGGAYAVRSIANYAANQSAFGTAGPGGSIPAPGDYDGDGQTDLAVYLPASGSFGVRPSSGGPDVIVRFGVAGLGGSIPAPGDYDGDGKTDLAVYIPAQGVLAYRPSAGGPDVVRSFGAAGPGASIPAPGDYDGDGKTDLAVYLPLYGEFAYRPSAGGPDVIQSFGRAGTGQTIPIASIPAAQAAAVTTRAVAHAVPDPAANLALSAITELVAPAGPTAPNRPGVAKLSLLRTT